MEKETANKVLLAVCSVAKPGEYVIMNRSELAQNLPEGYERRDVDRAMMQLQADDCISVRYSDADVYCLSVLNKGFVFGEKLKEKEAQRAEEERRRQETVQTVPATSEEGQVAATELSLASSEENVVPYVKKNVQLPLKKLFIVCAGGAFLGGVLAGVILFLLSKIM